jgi:uncharacterized OsmC-like protein
MAIQRVTLESLGPDLGFRATGEVSGATMTVGMPGPDGAPAPKAMELLSMGLGLCMAGMTMEILEKKRIRYGKIGVVVESDRGEHGFTAMAVRLSVESDQLDAETLQKVIDLAGKHCPAHATLGHGVPITATGELLPGAGR